MCDLKAGETTPPRRAPPRLANDRAWSALPEPIRQQTLHQLSRLIAQHLPPVVDGQEVRHEDG